jgi:hypothetical protein
MLVWLQGHYSIQARQNTFFSRTVLSAPRDCRTGFPGESMASKIVPSSTQGAFSRVMLHMLGYAMLWVLCYYAMLASFYFNAMIALSWIYIYIL